jgi:hypothetical protein
MRFLIAAIALLILGVLGWYSGYAKEASCAAKGRGLLSSMLMARIMRSMAWRVGATLRLSAYGTALLTQTQT